MPGRGEEAGAVEGAAEREREPKESGGGGQEREEWASGEGQITVGRGGDAADGFLHPLHPIPTICLLGVAAIAAIAAPQNP